MSGYFAPGERVFLTAGIEVLEARVDGAQYGRYIISYKGSGYESEGRICVSGNRLYRSYDDAAAHITRLADVSSVKKATPQRPRAFIAGSWRAAPFMRLPRPSPLPMSRRP